MNNRAKWAYLSYNSIQQKIDEGVLDSYDVIYTKDTHENYIITPELDIWSVRSRIYTFDSVSEANEKLNINTDTYKGQIVAILNDDKYKAYIVNQNENSIYYTTPLSEDHIDYNTLGNKPIENLVGTLDEPIIITSLSSGHYKIKGQYKIANSEETVYLSATGDLFILEDNLIKRITKDTITDYIINNDVIVKKVYITDEYLNNQGYATSSYVDAKISAFETSIRLDIETYVQSIIEDVIADRLDTIIDEKLDEKIQTVTSDEVTSLFQ